MSSIVWAAVLIGLVLLAVALIATRSADDGQASRITALLQPDGDGSVDSSLLEDPMARLVGVVVVVLLAGIGLVFGLGGEHLELGALVLVLVAALFAGSYVAVEKRRLSPAAAMLVSSAIVGATLLLVVVVQLIDGL